MSLKDLVTPPGIDPGTVRLIAQRLNHYVTPGPNKFTVNVQNGTTVEILLFIKSKSTINECS